MKEAYVNFLNHCYVDTEVEMKEIYASNHMWTMFEKSFLPDMNRVADQVAAAALVGNTNTTSTSTVPYLTRSKSHRQLTKYVCDSLITVIGSFFGSPFSSTAAAVAAAATVSTSSDHHRLRSGIDEVGSSSSVLAASTLATNSNATEEVQVIFFYGLIYMKLIILEIFIV